MKKISIFLTIVLLLSTMTGCWNRKEPNTLAILDSIIYDINDDGTYHIILELFNPTQSSGSEKANEKKNLTIISESDGPSAFEAIRNATISINRKVYIPHTKARFFTEKLASKDIISLMDFFLRDHETRQNSYMAVIKGDHPELLYQCTTGLADSIGSYINSLAEAQEKSTSSSAFVTALDFMKDYYEDGKQPVAGVVEIVEDKTKSSNENSTSSYKIDYAGLAVFKDEKMVGYLNQDETQAYNIITNQFRNALFTLPSENNYEKIVLEAVHSKASVKARMENGRAIIDLSVQMGTVIGCNGGYENIMEKENYQKTTEAFNQLIIKKLSSSIKKVQSQYQSDIFGFGLYMHIQNPKEWQEIKATWDDYFSKAEVHITVKSSINRTGELKEPFKLEEE